MDKQNELGTTERAVPLKHHSSNIKIHVADLSIMFSPQRKSPTRFLQSFPIKIVLSLYCCTMQGAVISKVENILPSLTLAVQTSKNFNAE